MLQAANAFAFQPSLNISLDDCVTIVVDGDRQNMSACCCAAIESEISALLNILFKRFPDKRVSSRLVARVCPISKRNLCANWPRKCAQAVCSSSREVVTLYNSTAAVMRSAVCKTNQCQSAAVWFCFWRFVWFIPFKSVFSLKTNKHAHNTNSRIRYGQSKYTALTYWNILSNM